MKVLLVVGGVLFLLLALLLFIAAIVTYFIGRRRAVAAGPELNESDTQRFTRHPAPMPQPVAPPPVADPAPRSLREKIHPTPPPPRPRPPLAAEVDLGTVMIDSRKQQIWGALYATTGSLAGRVFPIDPKGFYIGRDAHQSQVVVESPSVSKKHVWVGVKDGAVTAIDQRSTNGTYLNTPENGVIEVRLLPGDTLILSDDVARFTYKT